MMAGSAYTLDRDRPKPIVPAEKACLRCEVVKPNTFEFFGKKLSGTRTRFATLDICKVCTNIKRAETRQETHEAKVAYENARFEAIIRKHK